MSAKGEYCPLIQKKCIEDRCKFWVHIRGKHPQSTAELDFPDCSIKWLPVLLIENAQQVRQAGAAIESARNEQAKGAAVLASALLASPQGGRVIEFKP